MSYNNNNNKNNNNKNDIKEVNTEYWSNEFHYSFAVVDTNTLIHSLKNISSLKFHPGLTVIIPLIVEEELKRLQKEEEKAREALQFISEIILSKQSWLRIQTRYEKMPNTYVSTSVVLLTENFEFANTARFNNLHSKNISKIESANTTENEKENGNEEKGMSEEELEAMYSDWKQQVACLGSPNRIGSMTIFASVSGARNSFQEDYVVNHTFKLYHFTDNMGNTSSVSFADKELATASEKGNLARVKFLIEKDGANINFCDEFGWSAILHATSEGHLDVIKYLISKGATTTQVTQDRANILHHAVTSQNESVMSFLLQYGGFDVNARNESGWTPLHLACLTNQTDIVKILLSHKADKEIRNIDGKNALDITTSPSLRRLLKEGASSSSEIQEDEEQGEKPNSGIQKSFQKLQTLQQQPRTPVEMKGYTYLGEHDSSEDLTSIATIPNNEIENNNNNNSEASSSSSRNNNNNNYNREREDKKAGELVEHEYKRIFDAIHVLKGIDAENLNLIQMQELIDFHHSEMQKYIEAKKILEEIRARELDLLMAN